jgi:diguanylate cyclase (GGDEF)-like protein
MGSFKFKLVAYFVLLALVPLAAAFWGYQSIAARTQTREADVRLQSGLRSGLAAYQDRLDAAATAADRLARSPGFAQALARQDRRALEHLLGNTRRLRIVGPHLDLGARPKPVATGRRVAVIGRNGPIGAVVAQLPLDGQLEQLLRLRAGVADGDRMRILPLGTFHVPSGKTATVSFAGERFRTLVSTPLAGAPGMTLAVLAPQSKIDSAATRTERRLLAALLATLLLVGLVAWLEGRSIVRSIRRLVTAANSMAQGDLDKRVPVNGRDELALLARSFNEMAEQLGARMQELETERERLQDAITLFGEALAATHDTEQLLRVVLDVEIEATGATSGLVIVDGGVAAQVGEPDGDDRIEVPLRAGESNFGHMILTGPAFDDDARMTAVSIAAHAVVALDNARLHRIVRHQALIDGLTGLANRRHAERSLETELARAERFGGPLAIVLCDLDDFKEVNDRHGHLAGDDVLRELATVLQETVRNIDIAARWGGEEFVLILPGTDAVGGAQLAERAREALADRTILTQEGVPVRVTASFGVASWPEHGAGDELLGAADSALYQAKNRGKNRVETAPEAARRP